MKNEQTINVALLRKELILSMLKHVYGHSKNFSVGILIHAVLELEQYILYTGKVHPTELDNLSKDSPSD